ncbi:MAG: hypothetical protein K2J08_00460 [Ruminococcus sp.]|nr:hypothetical protein [Ruminococcus sp.]
MDFSNNEIRKFLIDKLNKNNINCKYIIDDSYVDYNCEKSFEYITFDGEKQNFFISFLKIQTSLFIYDNEIMFIDDYERKFYTSSDTYGNIVYEGCLKSLSHEQILSIFYKLINLFNGVVKIEVCQEQLSEQYENYPKYNYKFRIVNPFIKEGIYKFSNIEIEVNNL